MARNEFVYVIQFDGVHVPVAAFSVKWRVDEYLGKSKNFKVYKYWNEFPGKVEDITHEYVWWEEGSEDVRENSESI